jgi:hypothetical protein
MRLDDDQPIPGWSSFTNSTPAFSSARMTWERVPVRAPISPSKDSMRRIVLMATFDFLAKSVWLQPTNARVAFNCLHVIER